MNKIVLIAIIYFIIQQPSYAKDHVLNLTVEYKIVNLAGKEKKAITVNGQIPAPTLHFQQGDHVTIKVHNRLDKATAIHWHGIIIPWQMDGVEGISQTGIAPGEVFNYKFSLEQAGTYWYHAHAGLQEQEGLYGALIIDPPKTPQYTYDKDEVIVLSDWSNTNADQILANLKKTGDYYAPDFPLQPSLAKFICDYNNSSSNKRSKLIADYKMMQQMRMSIYDFSDVAYDAYILNGNPNSSPWTKQVNVGDVVRLRFIGAAGSTIFHVKIPGAEMQMVHVQGNDVQPYMIKDFTIAPGETYDVLVKIEKNQPYIIYAESIDTVGAAYGALLTAPKQSVNYAKVTPFPEPLPVTQSMMSMMMGNMVKESKPLDMAMPMSMPMSGSMKMDSNMHMSHAMSHDMPTEPSIIVDKFSPPTASYSTSVDTKYQNVIAAVTTNDPHKPVHSVIKMELFGYMDRYIWFINGMPEYMLQPIILQPAKRYRIVFTNNSMMSHPMHLHGHWFILRKGNGAYDPLLHTIDVAPGATITADVDTDASGQWFSHCHLLYHMTSGMSRVFQYSTLLDIINHQAKPQNIIKQTDFVNRPIVRVDALNPIDASLVNHPMAHPMGMYLASFLEVGTDPFQNRPKLNFKGLYGSDYNKLELFMNDASMHKGTVDSADLDIFYWHLLDQFWAIKAGVNYFYRPTQVPYWQIGLGIEGLMPYFIDTNVRSYYHNGSVKLDIELLRDSQMTNNFFIRAGIRSILASKTIIKAQLGSGLNQMRYVIRPFYRLKPGVDVFAEYEYERNYGSFRRLQNAAGEATVQNTVTFGLTMIF
jgi:CopA family copper-resistance protein